MTLGIGPGDEVITSPFTFVSTAEVIALLGAKPVFVDIAEDTYNIDPHKIRAAVTSKTKAIIPISLYGQVADMDEINQIAKQNANIYVIEDAAQSFGASYRGKKSCNVSDFGCTSFFPSKPLGCYGDGGAIFTSNDKFAEICKQIRIHGQSARYYHERVGVGGRMDTLQCAIVLAKLENFEQELILRAEAHKNYNELINSKLKHVQPKVQTPLIRSDRSTVTGQYTIRLKDRENVINRMKAQGIPLVVHYPIPLNEQPAFKKYGTENSQTPIAARVSKEVVSLPFGPYITKEQQQLVIKSLLACLN